MIKFLHPYAAVLACILTLTYLHYTTAHKKHNLNEYLVENKRTRFTKQNYVVQRDLNNLDSYGVDPVHPYDDDGEVERKEDYTVPYKVEGSRKEDDLPALIVDYANMIRNDIILMDNLVQTRTRKRGNVVGNLNRSERDLGEDSYPRYIETKECNETLCPPLYACQKSFYNITVLKRRSFTLMYEKSEIELPDDLKHDWYARKELITVGCSCLRDYVTQNN